MPLPPHPLFQTLVPFRIGSRWIASTRPIFSLQETVTLLFPGEKDQQTFFVCDSENEQDPPSSMIVTDQRESGGRPQRSCWLSNPVDDK